MRQELYVRNIKKGFATNSSSYHSTIILTQDQYDRWIDPANNVDISDRYTKPEFVEGNVAMVYNENNQTYQSYETFKQFVEDTEGSFEVDPLEDPGTGERKIIITYRGMN